MIPTVRIAFDLSLAGAGDFFTLNDPVKGELDNSTFLLAGDVYEDVSEYVRSVSVRRGRSRELTAFTAGQATVVLDNRARLFDPTASASVSPYAPSILPRKEISIAIGSQDLFTGIVEDWDLEYNLNRDATTTAKCTDALTLLADPTLTASTSIVQGSGARVNAVLDDIGWSAAKRRIATGVTTLGADVIAANTKALPYLQSIDLGEGGGLFAAKDGSIEFLERTDSQFPATVIFTDDGSGIPFTNIQIDFGTESLYTQVVVDYVGGSLTATAVQSSIDDYGVVELNTKTLLADSVEAANFAEFYLFRYSTPVFRINGLQVAMNGLSAADQALILGLELGDPVKVIFTPQGIGDPIEQALVVDQIEHSLNPSDHQVRFNFSQTLVGFILDTDKLDEGKLGF